MEASLDIAFTNSCTEISNALLYEIDGAEGSRLEVEVELCAPTLLQSPTRREILDDVEDTLHVMVQEYNDAQQLAKVNAKCIDSDQGPTARSQLETRVQATSYDHSPERGARLLARMKTEGSNATAIRLVENAAEEVDSACAKAMALLEEQTWVWGTTDHPSR